MMAYKLSFFMEMQKLSVEGATGVSVAHLRNLVALQDARSEGGRFAQGILEADRRLAEMPEGVRDQILAKLEGMES
jgi:hypothetical protein